MPLQSAHFGSVGLGFRGFRVLRVFREFRVFRVFREFRMFRVFRVLRVLRGFRGLMVPTPARTFHQLMALSAFHHPPGLPRPARVARAVGEGGGRPPR